MVNSLIFITFCEQNILFILFIIFFFLKNVHIHFQHKRCMFFFSFISEIPVYNATSLFPAHTQYTAASDLDMQSEKTLFMGYQPQGTKG